MRTRSELLADLRDMGQDETLTAIDRATAAQAADLLESATPRPWPPPEGVRECWAWSVEYGKWVEAWTVMGDWTMYGAGDLQSIEDGECTHWLPMPPEPEVGPWLSR